MWSNLKDTSNVNERNCVYSAFTENKFFFNSRSFEAEIVIDKENAQFVWIEMSHNECTRKMSDKRACTYFCTKSSCNFHARGNFAREWKDIEEEMGVISHRTRSFRPGRFLAHLFCQHLRSALRSPGRLPRRHPAAVAVAVAVVSRDWRTKILCDSDLIV